jgi:ketosteroid isomerase-like protein
MRLIAFSLLVVLATNLSAAQQDGVVRSTNPLHAEFVRIAERWLAAYNGTDAKQLEALYTQEAQYISGHVRGLVAAGRDKVIANFQKGMSQGGHIDVLQVLSVTQSCDIATVLCEYEATNAGQKANGRTLLLMKRSGTQWHIYLHMTVV